MSKALMKELNEQRLKLWNEAQGILDGAAAAKRDLDTTEDQRFNTISAEMDKLGARITQLGAIEEQNAAANDAMTRSGIRGGGSEGTGGELEQKFRAVAEGTLRGFEIAPEKGSLAAAVRSYGRRDLVKGTTTAGGFTVGTTFYGQLMEYLVDASSILQLNPTVIQTAKGDDLAVPIVTSFGSAALVAEGGTIAESDPVFAKRTLGAYKYGELVQVSYELLTDSLFDVESFVARIAGRNVGIAMNTDFAVGNGSSKPAGVMSSATVGVTGGTGVAGAFTADNLIDLYYSVPSQYRASRSAAWLLKDASMAAIRKFKDTTNQYLYSPGLVAGVPDQLLGKPIATVSDIAATGLSAKSVAFGDFSAYWVRLAGGVRFERSDDFAFDKDLVTFRCLVRGDGILVDQSGAIKVFQGGAT